MTAENDSSLDGLVEKLEELCDGKLHDRALIREALTHASVESATLPHNERLEFLGDAVLGLSITSELYLHLQDAREGTLTELRSHLVSRRTAARLARNLGLERWINTGKSLEACKRTPASILGNALEALVGAVYLQRGYEGAQTMVKRLYAEELASAFRGTVKRNEKMRLQEWTQKASLPLPQYSLINQQEDDLENAFEVQVRIRGRVFPAASGSSKREAERLAARAAIQVLEETGWEDDS